MKGYTALLCIILSFLFCTAEKTQKNIKETKIKNSINLKLIISDTKIENPLNDRRCFYKIFIDKIDSGRTSTGLESQMQSFEALIQPNRHLLTLEKWILDQKNEKYIKLNNIEQPKPRFLYFDLPEDKIAEIIIQIDHTTHRAAFSVNLK